MSIVQDAEAKGSRILFVCDRQTLVDQTSDRFAANGIRHGVAMGKQTRNTSERIHGLPARRRWKSAASCRRACRCSTANTRNMTST